ncbi:hypothetical protein KIW84_050962 [Lathyrus oleraceus]|uniref:Uncharacterized protein n=1 Tax=Pisum sativum TaxID=3888 RepID=A0A9D4WKW9_PEA|nr:hypothetical protein KIW84_050962 [Pisum sativum]
MFLKRQENECVFMLLDGLNKDLDDVRGRVLGKIPLPALRETFVEIIREEAQREVMMGKTPQSSESEGSTLVTWNLNKGRGQRKFLGMITACANGIRVKLVGISKDLNSGKMIGSAKDNG